MSREACIELAEAAGVDPDELVEWWQERAAVREYDGNQPRPEAERDALEDMHAMLEIGPWVLGKRKGPRSVPVTATRESLRRTQS